MTHRWIKNYDELAVNQNRKHILSVIEAGLDAMDTKGVVLNALRLSGDILNLGGQSFDLSKWKRIKILAFGKASAPAVLALEQILGDRISGGVTIGLEKAETRRVESFIGSHPKPSLENVVAGAKICDLLEKSDADDLVIVVVSGGGSAMLSATKEECEQGIKLYDLSVGQGIKITELNTLRKHTSVLKGGGLAKIAYPATVIGLIFSDVPGDDFDFVASGPTYKDFTTVQDAERIIESCGLSKGDFIFNETPKEEKYFGKVHNFVLVSNEIAVKAMHDKSSSLGFNAQVVSTLLYGESDEVLGKIFDVKGENVVVLGAGEPKIRTAGALGKGGRNLHLGLTAIVDGLVEENSVFVSFASDGIDNTDCAGAVVDMLTKEKAMKLGLNPSDYLARFDSYNFFKQTGDLIVTGPTGINVSDLMVLLNKNNE